MDTFDKRKFTIRALRFFLALSLFTATSLFSNFLSYFIAQRLTNEVSEDVIRVIHIIISLLAYHSLFYAFISTDNVIRKEFFDGNIGKIKYIATNIKYGK